MKPQKIRRFSRGERIFHWANAGLYLVLFFTGALILIGRIFVLESLPYAVLSKIHRTCGVMLVGVLAAILVLSFSLPTFRELWKTLRECLKWNKNDVLWLIRVPINMVHARCALPPVGKFNPGQKMHLLAIFLVLLGFSASGLIMIRVPGALGAWVIHLVCFVPVIIFLSLHLFLSLINPETRKALPAIWTGFINADYASAHHALWDGVPQGTSMHGSYVSWKWVCVVGTLLLIGLGVAVQQHGLNAFCHDLDALVKSCGATAILPGPLCAVHGDEEELQTCRACHSVTRTVQNEACVACHEIIAERLKVQSGFHGTLHGPCRECHAEHQGLKSSLIDLEATGFTHTRALFPLEGRHLNADCEDCHIVEKDGFRYLGIEFASCVSCHEDPHQDEQAETCEDCHTPETWSFGSQSFNHEEETSFALKGKHKQLNCSECHEKEDTSGESWIQLFDLGTVCLDCHKDPHAGQFTGGCEECHSEDDFREIQLEQFHGDSGTFLLKGQHARLKCQLCHTIPDGQTKLAQGQFVGLGRNCTACHEDPHRGQFVRSCDQCHVEQGFGEVPHGQFHGAPGTFVLEGKHQQLKCQVCHVIPDGQNKLAQAQFVELGRMCADCHEDPHQGHMDHACDSCHQERGFAGSHLLFAHDQHTRFALDGQHKALRCEACHPNSDSRYEAAGIECQDCHTQEALALEGRASTQQLNPDPHFNRLACSDCHDLSLSHQSREDFAARCEACHTPYYRALFWNSQNSLSNKLQALENQISRSSLTLAQRDLLRQRLREASRIGFHHMQLTQELLKQLRQGITQHD